MARRKPYGAIMDDVMRLLPGTRQYKEWRLKKIEILMEADLPKDSEDGKLLEALICEQIEAEKDFAQQNISEPK
jgi:hypothetical protein